jgi:nitrite reductase/ring-hydroxylating ferredoxin subunit
MADAGLSRICGSPDLVDGGTGVRFEVTVDGQLASAFVVRHGGRVVAYLNRCAHLGLELDWIEGRFFDAERRWLICAAHGALYDPTSGACAGGACAGHGALAPLQVVERDGSVYWCPALRRAGPAPASA